MSISGLVLTLSNDDSAAGAISALAADQRLTLGDRFGPRLAVVAETPCVASDRELWDQLRSTPGIANVDVTFVHLDEQPVASEGSSPARLVEDKHAHG